MNITCPDTRLKAWKTLVAAQGEPIAYLLWNEYESIVPEQYYTSKQEVSTKKVVEDPDTEFFAFTEFTPPIEYSESQQIEVARSFDSLLVDYFAKEGRVTDITSEESDFNLAWDIVETLVPESLIGNVTNYPDYMRSVWRKYTNVYPRITIEEDQHSEKIEEGETHEKEFDKSGNDTPAFDLVPTAVKAIYGTLPTEGKYFTGVTKLANPVEIHHAILDKMNGVTSLEEVFKRLSTMKGLPYTTLYSRLGIDASDFEESIKNLSYEDKILIGKFWKSVHMVELPFKVLSSTIEEVETENGIELVERLFFMSQTGRTDDSVYSMAARNVARHLYKNEKERVVKNGVLLTNDVWKAALAKSIEDSNWQQFAIMLGLEGQVSEFNKRRMNNLKAQLLEDVRRLKPTNDPLRDLVRLKDSQNSTYQDLMSTQVVKKTRTIQGPNGQLISGETIPNSITQIMDAYNLHLGQEVLPSELGFMNTPRFKHSLSARRFRNKEKMSVVAYGGIEGMNNTTKLSNADWLRMNIYSMLTNGYIEGFHRGGYKSLTQMLKESINNYKELGNPQLLSTYSTLTEDQQNSLNKFLLEILLFSILGIASALVWDDDDEERYQELRKMNVIQQTLIASLLKTRKEVETFILPFGVVENRNTLQRSLNEVFPVISQLLDMTSHIDADEPFFLERYKRDEGIHDKGDIKLFADISKLLGNMPTKYDAEASIKATERASR